MAYLKLQPIDPALESLLANLTATVARGAGNDLTSDAFLLNRLRVLAEQSPDEFAGWLRARARVPKG